MRTYFPKVPMSYLPTIGAIMIMTYVSRYNPELAWCYLTEVLDLDSGVRHVLFTEPFHNSGMSITNASEDVATFYANLHLGWQNFDAARVRFYESYQYGGAAGGGVDIVNYRWELLSEAAKTYGTPWRNYPTNLEAVAYQPIWTPGTREDEERFGLPPRGSIEDD